MAALRLLFTRGPETAWRPGFDLAQAAAALDLPLELGFAGAGLRLILAGADGVRPASFGAFASLELLGIESVRTPEPAAGAALPLAVLDAGAWRDWLRAGALQAW